MVGEINRGGLVGGRGIIDPQFISVGQRYDHRNLQPARGTLLAIGAGISEFDGGAGLWFSFPNHLIKPFEAAVQVVWAVVYRQVVGLTVKGKLGFGDAVG